MVENFYNSFAERRMSRTDVGPRSPRGRRNLAPDEAHNADGKHIRYLDPTNRQHRRLAACDPDLIEQLARVVATGRSVDALNQSAAIPRGSRTHSETIASSSGPGERRAWHCRALDALAGADVVFADPDNGICSLSRTSKLHKYALIDELADYARRGQSLVAYQHADRSAKAHLQATRRLGELAAGVQQEPAGAVIARRGSCRFFLITAAESHRDRLDEALRRFVARWASHTELVLPPVWSEQAGVNEESKTVTRYPAKLMRELKSVSARSRA